VLTTAILALLLALQGPPFFYWGSRPAVIVGASSAEPAVEEIHTVVVGDEVILRFTWNQPVEELLFSQEGRPVSGRLRATLYWDTDGTSLTGEDFGRDDLRSGADLRLDVGVVAIGEDPAEGREARPLVTAALYSLSRTTSQSLRWRTDSDVRPLTISRRGTWLELRIPANLLGATSETRLTLAQGGVATSGRFRP
jgi:hypothetical protein